jgi:hypothetical protein
MTNWVQCTRLKMDAARQMSYRSIAGHEASVQPIAQLRRSGVKHFEIVLPIKLVRFKCMASKLFTRNTR